MGKGRAEGILFDDFRAGGNVWGMGGGLAGEEESEGLDQDILR